MQHGEVKERGTHSELLKLEGVYKNLVSRQLVADEIEQELNDWNTTYKKPILF